MYFLCSGAPKISVITPYPQHQSQRHYRPQRNWAKVIFSQACVKNSVHRGEGVCLSACWDTPPGADTPPSRHPPREQTPPLPREADCSIRSMSDRYASYWNAFLSDLLIILLTLYHQEYTRATAKTLRVAAITIRNYTLTSYYR